MGFEGYNGHKTKFLSTLPARGATGCYKLHCDRAAISIHAPREGSDGLQVDALTAGFDISIHAPREGSDELVRA